MWAIDPPSLCSTECDYLKLIRLWPHFTDWYYRAHVTPGCTPTQSQRTALRLERASLCLPTRLFCRDAALRACELRIDGWPPPWCAERDFMAHIAAAIIHFSTRWWILMAQHGGSWCKWGGCYAPAPPTLPHSSAIIDPDWQQWPESLAYFSRVHLEKCYTEMVRGQADNQTNRACDWPR